MKSDPAADLRGRTPHREPARRRLSTVPADIAGIARSIQIISIRPPVLGRNNSVFTV